MNGLFTVRVLQRALKIRDQDQHSRNCSLQFEALVVGAAAVAC